MFSPSIIQPTMKNKIILKYCNLRNFYNSDIYNASGISTRGYEKLSF